MSRRHQTSHPCPTPSKRRYPDIEAARASLERDEANQAMRHLDLADWAYKCNCGAWHRTRRHDRFLGGVPLHG